ncbi:MFS transporter [Tsukamurella sp. 8F]|uniref:MFS transporter n=1 Tax=unclassified Tsukamurella TaxID=2633480 RepID=UPI0023B977B5|nr:MULTISPECIES: MFS transporter [unclassified Tsukamurella]MDF0528844.1 MFS transporter [Tsukamurella sp. 8J]MDF0586679.1 MFS transporter [Tsukamurella sp. 8F]
MTSVEATVGPVSSGAERRRVAVASLIGTSVEWYDFYLYGTASALVLGPLFFPHASAAGGILAAFATYAVGFVARPVGGALAGHFGDRVGRKAVLVGSLLLMGVATTAIGLLPTYASVGFLAPVLLTVLRLLQGLSAGIEWGGAVLLAVEHAPVGRRGLYGAVPQTGSAVGMILASSVFTAVHATVDGSAFLSWGWRIPFLLSAVLVIVGLIVRLSVADSPEFIALRDTGGTVRAPVGLVLRRHGREVGLTVLMRIGQIALYTLYTVFLLTYIAHALGHRGTTVGLVATLVASVISLVATPLWGALSDRIGRRRVYLFGALFTVLFTVPAFLFIDTGAAALVVAAYILGLNLGHDSQYGAQAAFFSELFPTELRYSGASIGYAVGAVVGGGLTPLIAAAALDACGGRPWLVAAYLMVLAAVSAVGVCLAPETRPRARVEAVQG